MYVRMCRSHLGMLSSFHLGLSYLVHMRFRLGKRCCTLFGDESLEEGTEGASKLERFGTWYGRVEH